jgi:hypothetical protein
LNALNNLIPAPSSEGEGNAPLAFRRGVGGEVPAQFSLNVGNANKTLDICTLIFFVEFKSKEY